MWKTIVLCASLFGGAALGLAAGARWVEPAALPAAGAIGLCLVGIVLILAAPARDEFEEKAIPAPVMNRALAHTAPTLETLEEVPVVAAAKSTPSLALSGPQPTLH